jgi:hypothetical protein
MTAERVRELAGERESRCNQPSRYTRYGGAGVPITLVERKLAAISAADIARYSR